jgi:hypothetical protein
MSTKTDRKSGKKTSDATDKAVVRALLDRQQQTYPAQAGIRLRNTPGPLYQTLVLAVLLSARIRADTAVAAARALFDAGLRDARSMADASWQERVDALGEGGYRRYDERTSTLLGKGAELLLERYDGDLRRLREEPDPSPPCGRGSRRPSPWRLRRSSSDAPAPRSRRASRPARHGGA